MTTSDPQKFSPMAANSSGEPTYYGAALQDSIAVLKRLSELEDLVVVSAKWCLETLEQGGKIVAFGNGGSACEAQHLVGELMGRYKSNRRPLAAVALTADTAVITCIGNDFNFDDIFARQVQGLCRPGDLLIAFSTSGNSLNIVRALETGRQLGIRSIAFLGHDGGKAAPPADCALIVPHRDTARIQEGHNFLMHSLMDVIEASLGVA